MLCPVSADCAGRRQGIAEALPVKAPKRAKPHRHGTAWWIATFPGICLFLLVLSVNICGDHLRDRFDPRSLVR